jgi:hypothetical protein
MLAPTQPQLLIAALAWQISLVGMMLHCAAEMAHPGAS